MPLKAYCGHACAPTARRRCQAGGWLDGVKPFWARSYEPTVPAANKQMHY